MMVQRTLAARSISHAQGGTLLAGYLKLLPVFLIVIPGMISRVLFTGKIHIVFVLYNNNNNNNNVSAYFSITFMVNSG